MVFEQFLKYLIAISIVLLIPNNRINAQSSSEYSKLNCIVIDPGHGGKHPGAISKYGNLKEKDITLAVALKLGKLLNEKYPDLKVIYTRTKDDYIDLDVRAAIANRNKADLFLSIHCNAVESSSANGTETFVMGTSKSKGNFEVCKTENSVITVENNYETKYEGFNPDSPESYIIFSLLQNTHLEQSLIFASHIQSNFAKGPILNNRGVKQGGLLVLWKTTMPAVLTEIGFLSNPKDRAVLANSDKQQEIAISLFNAFSQYKREYEGGTLGSIELPQINIGNNNEEEDDGNEDKIVKNIEETNTISEFYSIQIMSIQKKLSSSSSFFKGIVTKRIKTKNTYKYITGEYSSKEQAQVDLLKIRKLFPQAFVTKVLTAQIDN